MLDLPKDSLGPKPTVKQMELLKKMAAPGVTVHTWEGVRLSSRGAYLRLDKATAKSENLNRGVVEKFVDWGWLERVTGDFKGTEYAISERARKVIEKGETRK